MRKIRKGSALESILNGISKADLRRTESRMMIAIRIAEALRQQGLSQKDLADKLGKCPSEISKWLSGSHNFTVDTLSDIETALNIRLLCINEDNSLKLVNTTYVMTIMSGTKSNMLQEDLNKYSNEYQVYPVTN